MSLTINRKQIKFNPDPSRVIARFFFPGRDRAGNIIEKVMSMSDNKVTLTLNQVLREFSSRHRNITKIFEKHYRNAETEFADTAFQFVELSDQKKLLIGSYFTSEYSIESAAFFNPSIVEHPDQSNLENGMKRVIISFRATGEGHISSIVFREGELDSENNLHLQQVGNLVDEAEMIKRHVYNKKVFIKQLDEMKINKEDVGLVMDRLDNEFIYGDLQAAIIETMKDMEMTYDKKKCVQTINWLADSHYEITFSLDTAVADRVIFPISYTERNGIEDARFVRFVDNDGTVTYYATYTAYDGYTILPKLIETNDFYHFKVKPLNGECAQNKNLALFPRKINGKYAMIARLDGVNNYLMYSDKINLWNEANQIQKPGFPWQFMQIGNCGSPIETDKGWLLIVHGVGPMRRYCLGAVLLDLHNPQKIIGQLEDPLLCPNEEEREGYVPNVVYSCGSIINNDELIIPYAMADYASTLATVPLDDLLDAMVKKPIYIKKPGSEKKGFILIVDDDPHVLKTVERMLKSENYEVETACDGVDALVKITQNPYDLILSDIKMPKLSGFQLLETIKKEKLDVPVLLFTGEIGDDYEVRSLKMGAVEFIKKPIKKDILLLRIKRILDHE